MTTDQAPIDGDQLIARWTAEVEQLWQDTSYLFWSRKFYRAIAHMFQTNTELQEHGSDVWRWIRMLYGREAVMGIRRDMDDQKNAVSLVNVLYDMERHATVLTRERFRSQRPTMRQFMASKVDEAFERVGGPPGPGEPTDHIRPEVIAEDRKALSEATAGPVRYANLELAHRQPMKVTVPFKEVDEALGALFNCFKKYYAIITAADLLTPTPIPQFDWLRPFRHAWITDEFDPPKDKWEL